MRHYCFNYDTIEELEDVIISDSIELILEKPDKSYLIQFYTSNKDKIWFEKNYKILHKHYKDATIIGSTSVGEIISGKTYRGTNVVAISEFECSHIEGHVFHNHYPMEFEYGVRLGRLMRESTNEVKGLLLLATSFNVNMTDFFEGMNEVNISLPVFGGASGSYDAKEDTLIMLNGQIIEQGIVAVTLSGKELNIFPLHYLGWKAVGPKLRISKSTATKIMELDNENAYDVYNRYISVEKDDNFHLNAISFTLMIERDGELLSRVPVGVSEEGYLIMVADIKEGEYVQLGYGDPSEIFFAVDYAKQRLEDFQPQGIYVFSCSSRHTVMNGVAKDEAVSFNNIATTSGFYTYGEYYGFKGKTNVLNSAVVAVGISEDCQNRENTYKFQEKEEIDLYDYKDRLGVQKLTNIMKRLDTDQFLMDVELFGKFSCRAKDSKEEMLWRTNKTKELMIYLLDKRGVFSSKDMIIEALWPNEPIDKATKIFYTTTYYLRNVLKKYNVDELLIKKSNKISLDAEKIECDMYKYLDVMITSNINRLNVQSLMNIDGLFNGEFLAGEIYVWLVGKDQWLSKKRVRLKYLISQKQFDEGLIKEACDTLLDILNIDNMEENAHKQLIKINIMSNNIGDAIKYFKKYEKVLVEELGIKPDSEITNYVSDYM